MNVFVLGTGRCGTVTFVKACSHITNYTAGHETRSRFVGRERLQYVDGHIEADNRLSWFLGRLDQQFGDGAFYVHLRKDDAETARSYARRKFKGGIIPAYYEGILMGLDRGSDVQDLSPDTLLEVSRDYCETVNSNIELFLKDKSNKMTIRLESVQDDFARFWKEISAEGDLNAALAEWDVRYNATREAVPPTASILQSRPKAIPVWLNRLQLPAFRKLATLQ
jgi:hypothetical protein